MGPRVREDDDETVEVVCLFGAALSAARRCAARTICVVERRGRRSGEAVAGQAHHRIVREAHGDRGLRLDEIGAHQGHVGIAQHGRRHRRARARRQHHRRASRHRCLLAAASRVDVATAPPRSCGPLATTVSIPVAGRRVARRGADDCAGSARWPRRCWRGRPANWPPARRPAPRSGGNAGGRLRIGGGERLAGVDRGDLRRRRLLRRRRGVAPEAAGIDDVGRRLRLRLGRLSRRRRLRLWRLHDLRVGRGELEGRGDRGLARGAGTGSADLAGAAEAVTLAGAGLSAATAALASSSSSVARFAS